MSLIPLLPADLAEPAELVAAIRARRGGTLLNLDRLLLHSPVLAQGWNTFMGAVRTGLSVDPRLAELAICEVAVLNGADYEFLHHAPEYLRAGGSQAQLDALQDTGGHPDPALFDERGRDTLALTAAMTREIRVPEALLARLRDTLGTRALVELIATVAAYNMVSRLLVAGGVVPEQP